MKTRSPRHLYALHQAGKIDPDSFLQELIRYAIQVDERLNGRLLKLAQLNAQVTAIYQMLNLDQPSLHELDGLGRREDDFE